MDLITQFARVEIVPLNPCLKKNILGMLRQCQEQGKACGLKKIPFALRLFSSIFKHNEYMFGLGFRKHMNNKGGICNCHLIINIDENEFPVESFFQ